MSEDKINFNTRTAADLAELSDEEFYAAMVKFRNSGVNRFADYIGVVITGIGPGWAEGEITLDVHHGNPIGSIHGGALFALADSVGGAAAISRKRTVTTVSATMNYLNASLGGKTKKIRARADELKCGRSTSVYDVKVYDDDNRLLTQSTMTYFCIQKGFDIPSGD